MRYTALSTRVSGKEQSPVKAHLINISLWRRWLFVMLVLGLLWSPVDSAPRAPAAVPDQDANTRISFPLIGTAEDFGSESAIWPANAAKRDGEVALFRRTFTLAEALATTTLDVFADTRYEVWLDGQWVGRGPARFSRVAREFDQFAFGTLPAGTHTLAVLVQWAPNTRRSESTQPMLQARLRGADSRGQLVTVQADHYWRGIVAPGWRSDSAQIHEFRLIGPIEQVDLREYPPDWMSLTFDDSTWPVVETVVAPATLYRPRSIAQLSNVPITPVVREAGVLAPERTVREIRPVDGAYRVTFQNAVATILTTEVLSSTRVPLPERATLDGRPITFIPVEGRLDIAAAQTTIEAGNHTLAFEGLTGDTWVYSLAGVALASAVEPIAHGSHPGRRLLFAEPVARPDAVVVGNNTGLDLTFGDQPSYVVLDLGRIVHGRIVAEVTGPPGSTLDIGWDERLLDERRPLPFPGTLNPYWDQTDSWVLDGTTRTISTIDSRTGRYLLLATWGKPIDIRGLRVLEERYPLQQRGAFVGPSPRLNAIWRVGVDTLYLNMTDAYADPLRERGQWWGDAFVVDRANQVTFGETALLRRGLLLMAEAMRDGKPSAYAPSGQDANMLDYGMLWVLSMHDYLRLTGDITVPRKTYASLQAFIAYVQRYAHPETGLLDIPVAHWSQTVYIDSAAGDSRYGQSTAVNAMYYGTLLDSAAIAEQLGDTAQAAVWRQVAAEVKAQVNQRLYRPAEGRYSMSIRNGVAQRATPYAQAWPLAYGLVPPVEQGRVADALLALLRDDPARPGVEIYGMNWVLEGLGRAGRLAEAQQLIERTYGRMLDLGATAWWESFTANERYDSSLSHGWGSSPSWFLTTYILGARQTGPDNWAVTLPSASAGSASGTLPLRRGLLNVDRRRTSCSNSVLTISAPAGTAGTVVLPPLSAAMTVTVNGTPVWQNNTVLSELLTQTPDGARLQLEAGQHQIGVDGELCAS